MDERTLKRGTALYFGAPAKPMPEILVDAISQVVSQVSGIVEAHLPQCFIEGDTEARQILVVVVQRRAEISRIAEELMNKLQLALPPGQFIDILPFESGTIMPGIREADCQIYAGEKKAWWKIW
ncbi:MAG: enhanced serine sensitivity protein SseB C-terminal domain-containing protein [Planctomycetia bacterium]|nr:enhanced serine sensitivity protein SseB C-terminal domain-containing protein [Planctomycetia bacterium]